MVRIASFEGRCSAPDVGHLGVVVLHSSFIDNVFCQAPILNGALVRLLTVAGFLLFLVFLLFI